MYKRVRALHPDADHIMMAYDTKGVSGCHDDREFGAGLRLLRLQEERNDKNIATFVVRNFGGTLLGPKRFIMIENSAKEALDTFES